MNSEVICKLGGGRVLEDSRRGWTGPVVAFIVGAILEKVLTDRSPTGLLFAGLKGGPQTGFAVLTNETRDRGTKTSVVGGISAGAWTGSSGWKCLRTIRRRYEVCMKGI